MACGEDPTGQTRRGQAQFAAGKGGSKWENDSASFRGLQGPHLGLPTSRHKPTCPGEAGLARSHSHLPSLPHKEVGRRSPAGGGPERTSPALAELPGPARGWVVPEAARGTTAGFQLGVGGQGAHGGHLRSTGGTRSARGVRGARRSQGALRAPASRARGTHLTSAAADAASRPRASSSRLGGCMAAAAGSEQIAREVARLYLG